QTLELSGSMNEIGYKLGVKCKSSIDRFLEWFYEEFQGKITKEQALRHAKKHIPFIEEYCPITAEEMRGIAEGSGRTYEEITLISLHEEIQSFTERRCTAFAATGEATLGNDTYIGQNWDADLISYRDGEFPLLLNVKPDTGPNYLAYAYPGMPAGAGLNSYGIGLSWNSVPRLELTIGVPTYTIIAEILHQKTIGDALGIIIKVKRAGCFNFIIGDEDGEIYDVEATPSDLDIYYSDRYIGHANHYISEALRRKQKWADLSFGGKNPDTLIRHNRMNKFLKQKCGKIDLKVCMDFLKDHVNYPNSICRHPDSQLEPKKQTITYDSWVMITNKKEWWIAHGPPCGNEFKKYIVR
ncbi:MAG: C45 family peptidase, partial [Candidatus Bathyarchaeia archaeon]